MCSVAQSCLTLCDTMDCSPPGSLFRGFCRDSQRILFRRLWSIVAWVLQRSCFFFLPRSRTCLLLLLGSAPNSFVSPRIYSLCFSGKHSTDCKNTFNLVPNCIFNKLCLHPLPPPAFLQNSGFSESPETRNTHESWSSKQLMLSSSIMSNSCDPMD